MMGLPLFDQLLKEGKQTEAARVFAKEYYESGKMGHTRKALIEDLAKRVETLQSIYKSDVEYYMKEIERIKEEHAQDCFKLIELQTAIKIKDQTIQNVTSRLHETRNEIQTILDSPLTDFSELHDAISDVLKKG